MRLLMNTRRKSIARVNGSTSIANGSHTAVALTSITYDPDALYAAGPGAIIIPRSGWWRIYLSLSWPVVATGFNYFGYVSYNGDTGGAKLCEAALKGADTPMAGLAMPCNIARLDAGVRLGVGAYQTSGSAQTLTAYLTVEEV